MTVDPKWIRCRADVVAIDGVGMVAVREASMGLRDAFLGALAANKVGLA